MTIKYVVVALGDDIHLKRFEDPKDKIRRGKKLSGEFQRELYGPNEWIAQEVLSPDTTAILEGVACIASRDAADLVARDIFEAGRTAGKRKQREHRK